MKTPRKKWKYQVDNKMRGAYGETDYETKTIRINKKRHKQPTAKRITPKPNGHEHLGMTIYHEELHRKYPKLTEKEVRKREKNFLKLPKKEKTRLYKLIQK
jgi:hypothetical protein